LTLDYVKKDLSMTARHLGMCLAVCRRITEVAPSVDHLLRRSPADAELKPAARDSVCRPGILRHVERVLVPHVDDRCADLDPGRTRADGREKRKRRAELLGEVMDTVVGTVGAQFLGGHGQLDRLKQRVRRRADLRMW
jgi:hypothetical protein